jgi:hypothetical protein
MSQQFVVAWSLAFVYHWLLYYYDSDLAFLLVFHSAELKLNLETK